MLLLLLLAACAADPVDSAACVPTAVVVTDIDETLTTADEELWAQVADPAYDPRMRPDANTLLQGYAARGYAVAYVTARGEDTPLTDDRTMREITVAWLRAHDLPAGAVYLAPGLGVIGEGAVDYKAGVVEDLFAAGLSVDYGYGNADTDIAGFEAGGVPEAHLFLVGELAGEMGVTGISDADAYTAHLPYLDTVPEVPCTP